MHTHNGWEHSIQRRDPFSRIAAAIATLLLYLPLFFLALTHPHLLVAPVAMPPRTIETIVRLLPQSRPRVPPQRDFIAHKIHLHAVNAPMRQAVIVPAHALAPPALLPVTAAELSPLAGGALPGWALAPSVVMAQAVTALGPPAVSTRLTWPRSRAISGASSTIPPRLYAPKPRASSTCGLQSTKAANPVRWLWRSDRANRCWTITLWR
jgi:hypothetical protein